MKKIDFSVGPKNEYPQNECNTELLFDTGVQIAMLPAAAEIPQFGFFIRTAEISAEVWSALINEIELHGIK